MGLSVVVPVFGLEIVSINSFINVRKMPEKELCLQQELMPIVQ